MKAKNEKDQILVAVRFLEQDAAFLLDMIKTRKKDPKLVGQLVLRACSRLKVASCLLDIINEKDLSMKFSSMIPDFIAEIDLLDNSDENYLKVGIKYLEFVKNMN